MHDNQASMILHFTCVTGLPLEANDINIFREIKVLVIMER